MRTLAAEAVGTFALVFAGTSAIAADHASHGAVTHVGIAWTFGLVVMALIQSLGDVSGAHLNPAVTLAFVAAKRFPARSFPGYAIAQCAGAVAASLCVRALFPNDSTIGATTPTGDVRQAFALEALLTWLLMFVILSVSDGSKERGLMAGVAIGGVVALEALFAGPITGASMNPARSLGPALVSGELGALWLYVAAPIAGALAAVATCRVVRKPGCCTAGCEGAPT